MVVTFFYSIPLEFQFCKTTHLNINLFKKQLPKYQKGLAIMLISCKDITKVSLQAEAC